MSDNAVITRLHGGLGNQMFQYAAGRAVALRSGLPLALDLRYFEGDVPFGFGLDRFATQFEAAGSSRLPPDRRKRPLAYALWRALRLRPRLVREKGLSVNAGVLSIREAVYLHGYWQSERYFSDHAETIRSDFQMVAPPSPANALLLERIRSEPAVSLHVRRGDYASNPKTTAVHGLCSPEYYERALSHVADAMDVPPSIFVFSDDPDWAEANLRFSYPTTVVRLNDPRTSYEDMRLMSACRHNIIANSSFSWWGAWLNNSSDKIVVAPKRWFASPKMSNADIHASGWIKL